MPPRAELRLEAPSADKLRELVDQALPLGLRQARGPDRSFFRDVYFDTVDGELRRRGIVCSVRTHSDDRRVLTLRIGRTADGEDGSADAQLYEAEVTELEAADALRGSSDPARRLRSIIDPGQLQPRLDLTTERHVRRGRAGVLPVDQFEFLYDAVTVRQQQLTGHLNTLTIRQLRGSPVEIRDLANALEDNSGLRTTFVGELERAELLLEQIESEQLARDVQGNREVTVIAVEQGRFALARGDGDLRLLFHQGSGEQSCRELMREALGSVEGQVLLLGVVPATPTRPTIEVWVARRLRRGITMQSAGLEWFAPSELVARVGSPVLRHSKTLAALTVASRSDLLPEWVAVEPTSVTGDVQDESLDPVVASSRQTLAALRMPVLPEEKLDTSRPVPEQFFNTELSLLEFNARVLALAEDPGVPLLARVLFLSIFSSNMDEFFSIKVAGHKQAVAAGATKPSPDGLTPEETLEAMAVRIRALVERQYACAKQLLEEELPARGIRIRNWDDLSEGERGYLREFFDKQIFPLLTPKAITLAPGHPFPFIEDLLLSLAATVRDERSGSIHFAHIGVPDAVPRFVQLPDSCHFVPLEQVIRANLGALYTGRRVEEVHPFRLTRAGDLELDETHAASFAQAIEEEIRRRPRAPVVRLEIESSMPDTIRGLLLRELRFEEGDRAGVLTEGDVYAVDGMVDLGALAEIADLDIPELDYQPFKGADRFPSDRSIFDVLDEHDVLVHHPYDSFERSFERWVIEAADDPDVVSIKLTLYRPGGPWAIGNALERAAGQGKDVSVFVELKARFDEQRNLVWAKQLERAGIHVVTGLVRLKTHAKIMLIVRRTDGVVKRYGHVGTGNYNPWSARLYTDLGLFTASESITADLNVLFNELTGSSGSPQADFKRLIVSPTNMIPRLRELIHREMEHARAGKGGLIQAKMNSLSDKEMVGLLYQASQAGVDIDLIVRGICTLRPGVPGLSERIRVVSALGRFLEHARVFRFGNAGEDEWYIGSADWRPRNLRRRVEVLAPVDDDEARARLGRSMELEIQDPMGWELQSDGSYMRVTPVTGVDFKSAQETYIELAAGTAIPNDSAD